MAVSLPQELIDLIIEHTGDHDAFKTCSLLSHACLDSCRRYRFQTVSISDKLYSPYDAPEDSPFFRFWVNSSHLYTYVKVVRLFWSIPNGFKQLGTFLEPFIHLPTIEVHLFSAAQSQHGYPGFSSIIEHLAHPGSKLSTSITRLITRDFNLRSPRAFTAFPNLKILRVLGQSTLPASAISLPDRDPLKRIQLDELEVGYGISSDTLAWLERSIECSQLRVLKLNCSQTSAAFTRDGYLKFTSLVNCVAPTLHTFSFEPSNKGNTYPPGFTSLSQFPLLQKLIIHRGFDTFPGSFFLWTLTVLSDLPSTNPIQEITINFPKFKGLSPLPARPDPIPASAGEVQRLLNSFFDSLQLKKYQEHKDTLESIPALDTLLMNFSNLKMLSVVSNAPDTFFRERLPRLNKLRRLVLYAPFRSSVDAF